MLDFSTDQWIIVLLVFVLGLLCGGFLFSGGGRKWKQRYNAEVARRKDIETAHAQSAKEWREKESLMGAALKKKGIEGDFIDENGDRIDDRFQQ
nr:hypothetical protein [uncultured Sphingomonas sp.]